MLQFDSHIDAIEFALWAPESERLASSIELARAIEDNGDLFRGWTVSDWRDFADRVAIGRRPTRYEQRWFRGNPLALAALDVMRERMAV